jgi:hypothetical protein
MTLLGAASAQKIRGHYRHYRHHRRDGARGGGVVAVAMLPLLEILPLGDSSPESLPRADRLLSGVRMNPETIGSPWVQECGFRELLLWAYYVVASRGSNRIPNAA